MTARNTITWITSLSLDAPAVAVIWQHALSTHHHLTLHWYHRALVFLAVWLGYTADRWLDTLRHEQNISKRHAFHAVQRRPLFAVWIFVLGLSILLSVELLNPLELRKGISLAIASILATGFIQLKGFGRFQVIFKSALTAMLVTSSIHVFSAPESLQSIAGSTSIMTSLFFLNCSFIHSWDRFIDAKQESEKSLRCRTPIIVIATGGALTISLGFIKTNPLALYSLISVVFLFTRHFLKSRIHDETRRTLADIALLTPVLVLF